MEYSFHNFVTYPNSNFQRSEESLLGIKRRQNLIVLKLRESYHISFVVSDKNIIIYQTVCTYFRQSVFQFDTYESS